MAAHLVIFSNDIRVLHGLFSLNDLHKASGSDAKHKPSNFIRLDQTTDLIEEINRCSDLSIASKSIKGGSKQGTWVCKELVYAYAMWISAKFHLAVIRAFDQMHGGGGAPDTPITPDQFSALSQLIDGKVSGLPDKAKRSGQSRIWAQLHKAYSVKSGRDLPVSEFDSARQFIAAYAIEGEYLAKGESVAGASGQSELPLEPGESDWYRYSDQERLQQLGLSGRCDLPESRHLINEIRRYLPQRAMFLADRLEACSVRQWTQLDESLRLMNQVRHFVGSCRGDIDDLPSRLPSSSGHSTLK